MLKQIIQELEDHFSKGKSERVKFDLNNKRHFFHLNEKIKRLNADRLRKLSLIEAVLRDETRANDLYNNYTHYTRKRYND